MSRPGGNQKDYTVQEASDKIGVGRVAIYSAIRRQKVLSYKRGVTILIDAVELDRWNSIRRKRKTKKRKIA